MRLPCSVRRRGRLFTALLATCALIGLLLVAPPRSGGHVCPPCEAAAVPPPDPPCNSGGDPGPGNASQAAQCQPIHVALIVGGHAATRYAVTAVKSVLFHRANPIHLHLLTAGRARRVLRTLFNTWRIPHLRIAYYEADAAVLSRVNWVASTHYSGVYGLLKLVLPSVLPAGLDRVIVLDTDVVVTADLAQLWAQFDRFLNGAVIGLADNLSDWYLARKTGVWPALGRGFNTGVILMHLARMRAMGWDQRWGAVAKECAARHGPAQLADQDVMNALVRGSPGLLHRISCYWNVQLGDRTQPELCYQSPANLPRVRVLHWNSPLKVWGARRHRFAQHFHTLYMTYLDYDGGLLRQHLFACPDAEEDALLLDDGDAAAVAAAAAAAASDWSAAAAGGGGALAEGDECYEMRAEQRLVRRTHLFYLEFNYTSDGPNDVTLVSQLSLDRVQLLESLSRHWSGPISLCVYVTDAEAHQLTSFVESSQVLSQRRNIAYHLLMKEGQFYPVNHLRNVAMENAVTDHVFLLDFDFLPSLGLYEHLRSEIGRTTAAAAGAGGDRGGGQQQRKLALIVPAFETFQYKLRFPASKAELLGRLNLGEIVPFRQEVFREGHRATDFTRWKSATQAYPVTWQADFEPYVVIGRDAARFDTRFVGFGWNKVSFIMQLDILGFSFRVLPNAFIVHLPHAPSLDVARFRFMPEYRHCINTLKVEYIKYLAKRHGVRALKYLSFRKDAGSLGV